MPGSVLTFDALHAVKQTFEMAVVGKQVDVLVCVKGNASELERQLLNALKKKSAIASHAQTVNHSHGRVEVRDIEVVPVSPAETGWPHTHVACRVTRQRQLIRRGETISTSTEEVMYVGSFAFNTYSAERILGFTREHWGIENRLHHRKDRSMDEDRCRASARGSGRVMCCIRSIVALVLGRAKESLSVVQRRFAGKAHLALALFACGSLDEWESRYQPYRLA